MNKPPLISVLACPYCRSTLQSAPDHLVCQTCARSFPLRNGIALFLPEPVAVVSAEHQSHPLGPDYEATLLAGEQFVLHIGAGATSLRYPNCIEFEHKIFRHTDVVGDAHQLPFRDGVFDRVFAFNVFEHLRDPRSVAEEIFRVLKPGGSVAIHTAFLQPLHEEPAHFYNCTAYGAREWFAQFAIERCHVSANFSPAFMLGFLTSTLLETVRAGNVAPDEQTALGRSSLAEWARFWDRRDQPPPGFAVLQNLPQSLQERVAAGFELIARKPVCP
jgi:SAM-dependent methyltransferase